MLARMKVLVLFILLKFGCVTDGLQCYTCQNAGDVHDCNIVTTCIAHQSCLLDVTPSTNGQLYNMECADNQVKLYNRLSLLNAIDFRYAQTPNRPFTHTVETTGTEGSGKTFSHISFDETQGVGECRVSINSENMNMLNERCSGQSGGSLLVGRSKDQITKRQTKHCLECCSTDLCNQELCNHTKPSACLDSPKVDCALMSSAFNVCGDIQHAKLFCPQYCGLCTLVDGNWSHWSSWSTCDVTCGNGTESRDRTCTDPAPANGGLDCKGTTNEMRTCVKQSCPVHGDWSLWSPWGSCSVTCDIGMQRRDRSCSNPYPSLNGDHCFGDSRDDRICIEQPCANGGWSAWEDWAPCPVTCMGGLRSRQRSCTNPEPSVLGKYCDGESKMLELCNIVSCQDGHWSSWGQWGSCSSSCGSGLKTRSRSCSNPIPSTLGRYCVGDGAQTISCMTRHCPGSSFSVNTPTTHDCTVSRLFNTLTTLTDCSLAYSHVLHSLNADYNKQTGVFTCSTPGIYIFTLLLSTGSLDSMQCDLKLNSQIYTTIIIDSHESSNSITPIIHMNTYDRLAIVNCYINCRQADVSQLKSTFSGVLISPD